MHARAAAAALLLVVAASPGVVGADEGHDHGLVAPEPPPVHRSSGMRIAGIVLTCLGGAALIAGASVTAYSSAASGDKAPVLTVAVGLPLIGVSQIFAGIGVPLWVVGSQPPKSTAARNPWVPEVSVGAGSGAVRWSF